MIYTVVGLIIFAILFIVYSVKHSKVLKMDKTDPECIQDILDMKKIMILNGKEKQ